MRVGQVRHLAATSQHDMASLVRAAEAHNVAALILSDCGLTELARTLCWRQVGVFLTNRPSHTAVAKLALQPIVNLSRLLIRDGDGDGAYQLLNTLFAAVKSRTDAVIESRTIPVGDLLGEGVDHREIVQWLWTVLLSDGTRALTRTGQWAEALRHVQQHKGIGQRLLDSRQVAGGRGRGVPESLVWPARR